MTKEQYLLKLAKTIRDKRIELGYNQSDIAEAVGFTRVQYVNIENGRNSTGIYQCAIILQILGLEFPKLPTLFIKKAIDVQEKRVKEKKQRKKKRIENNIKQLTKSLNEL